MSEILSLEALRDFLIEKVTAQIRLKKPNDKNVMDYKLVNPSVHIGWIPPNGYVPKEIGTSLPCILVGHDDGEDNGEESSLDIRLSFAVWNPGYNDGEKSIPNFEGYRDLLNFIERTRNELFKQKIIKEKMTIQHPVKWGMYEEQPYPYWYGWMTFKIKLESIKYQGNSYKELLL